MLALAKDKNVNNIRIKYTMVINTGIVMKTATIKTHAKALYGLTQKDHQHILLSEEQDAEKHFFAPGVKEGKEKIIVCTGFHLHKSLMKDLLRN